MKKVLLPFLALACAMSVVAAGEDKTPQELKFTTIKENPITPIKNQNRSGTCWDYATLGYFEGEILKKTGKTYDLCEMFVANKNYMDEAI